MVYRPSGVFFTAQDTFIFLFKGFLNRLLLKVYMYCVFFSVFVYSDGLCCSCGLCFFFQLVPVYDSLVHLSLVMTN